MHHSNMKVPLSSMRTVPRKFVRFMVVIIVILHVGCGNEESSQNSYTPEWESLRNHQTPEWLMDAKFGIYTHWGLYSVPAAYNEYYSRNMYRQGNEVRQYHLKTYGPASTFGYKNFISYFTAEQFDPDEWAGLFSASGAKFAGLVAEHVDGFSMWDSEVSNWNAAEMGPCRDVVGELERAIRDAGLRFMVSLHHHRHWGWFPTYDTESDTSELFYQGLYGPVLPSTAFKFSNPDPPPSTEFQQQWLAKITEIIDAYHPDMICLDDRMSIIDETYRKDMVYHYYDSAAKLGQNVALGYREQDLPDGIGLPLTGQGTTIDRRNLEYGRGYSPDTSDGFRIRVSSIDGKSHSYRWNAIYKSSEDIISELVDAVSRNCAYLLNIPPRADGTFPDMVYTRLRTLGEWLSINGEAIYGTRPWMVSGEIPRNRGIRKQTTTRYHPLEQNIRFTQSRDGNFLYAIFLSVPETTALITSLSSDVLEETGTIASISLLGSDQSLTWSQDMNGLTIHLPDQLSGTHAFVVKIAWK